MRWIVGLFGLLGCGVVDEDGDGWTTEAGDCDDHDASLTPDTEWHADADGDGYGASAVLTTACLAPPHAARDGADCADANVAVHPGQAEVCDGIDQDCNGMADDGLEIPTWFADVDGDGFGADSIAIAACTAPVGFASAGGDCDDADSLAHPGATESCEVDFDSNCDGSTLFADVDSDGTPACRDCDDADGSAHPGAIEVCDAADADEDCDGDADDADADATGQSTWYLDGDLDGFGAGGAMMACEAPVGGVAGAGDCDDADARVSPGAREICGGVDEDCDGLYDEDDPTLAGPTVYRDFDGDGFGDPATGRAWCTRPADAIADGTDCDDAAPFVHPGADEICDGEQNDCGGVWSDADEDGLVTYVAGDVATDMTSTWATGAPGFPSEIALPSNTVVSVCRGSYYVSLSVLQPGRVDVVGVAGPAETALVAGGGDAVIEQDHMFSELHVSGFSMSGAIDYAIRDLDGDLFVSDTTISGFVVGLLVEGELTLDHVSILDVSGYAVFVRADALLRSVSVADCAAGVIAAGDSTRIEDSTFSDGGAALTCDGDTLDVVRTDFLRNSDPNASAVTTSAAVATLTDVWFEDNDGYYGGALRTSGQVTFVCTAPHSGGFHRNDATRGGGAVWLSLGTIESVGCDFGDAGSADDNRQRGAYGDIGGTSIPYDFDDIATFTCVEGGVCR